jgi:hypothetical protein
LVSPPAPVAAAPVESASSVAEQIIALIDASNARGIKSEDIVSAVAEKG